MKKNHFRKIAFLVVVLLTVFSLAACSKAEDTGNAEPAVEMTYLTMGTGGTSGTWYPVGGVISAAMSKSGTVSVTAQTSAASLENIRLVGSGERQLGLGAAGLILFAADGVEMFEGESYPDLASIANMMPNQFQFVVRADSGIESIYDLAGMVVGTGAPGSGDEVLARGILEALEVYQDVKPMQLSFGEQVTAFKNRQLDCIFAASPAPTSAILDAASQADVKFLSFEGETRDKVLEAMPYLVDDQITSKHYDFLTEDINTFAVFSTLFTSTTISEEVIYDAVKAMYEDIATINASHGAMANFTPEMAVSGLPVPLHPGAEKYYKEVGYIE
jgi:TRAP transporter TAXI family solute receptor